MEAKKATYLPNVYEMINSSAYQIATDTTDAHKEASKGVSATDAFGSRVIGKSTRCCKENTFWRTIAAVAALVVAIKHRKGIGKALKAVFKPIAKGLKNSFSWTSRLRVSVKPKTVKQETKLPKIKDLLKPSTHNGVKAPRNYKAPENVDYKSMKPVQNTAKKKVNKQPFTYEKEDFSRMLLAENPKY